MSNIKKMHQIAITALTQHLSQTVFDHVNDLQISDLEVICTQAQNLVDYVKEAEQTEFSGLDIKEETVAIH